MSAARISYPPPAVPRAKHVLRKPALALWHAERLRDETMQAACLDLVMRAFDVSNVTMGEWLGGISESIVRGLRSRQRPLTARHLFQIEAACPEFHEALTKRIRDMLRAPAVNDVGNGAGDDPAA
jgi:hypothetical protein